MSRFANPEATRTVDLGACECPGTPHDNDWVRLRADLSGSETAILLRLDQQDEEGAAEALAPFVAEWNLRDEDGPVDITGAALFTLKGPTLKAIGDGLSDVLRENLGLPNRKGAPSPASPRGSASPTRKRTRTPGT